MLLHLCFGKTGQPRGRGTGRATGDARRLVLILVLAFASLVTHPAASASATRLALLVAPSAVELRAAPGQQVVAEVLVSNQGEATYELSASLGRYGAGGRWSLEQLSRLEPGTLTLAPGEIRSIELHLTLPADLPAGGRYAAIWIETRVGGGLVGVGRYVVPVLLTVDADQDVASSIAVPSPRLSLPSITPILDQQGRLLFSVEAANSGSLHCDPSGELELADSTGAVSGRLPLALGEPLLPSTRQAALAGPLEVPIGRYRAQARLSCPDGTPAEATLQFSSEPRLELRRPDPLPARAESLTIELVNLGDVALEPVGSLFADDLGTDQVIRIDLEPRALLPPGGSLELEAEIPEAARSELAGLTALVVYGGEEPLLETVRPTASRLGPEVPAELLAAPERATPTREATPALVLPGLNLGLSPELCTLLVLALLGGSLCLLGPVLVGLGRLDRGHLSSDAKRQRGGPSSLGEV